MSIESSLLWWDLETKRKRWPHDHNRKWIKSWIRFISIFLPFSSQPKDWTELQGLLCWLFLTNSNLCKNIEVFAKKAIKLVKKESPLTENENNFVLCSDAFHIFGPKKTHRCENTKCCLKTKTKTPVAFLKYLPSSFSSLNWIETSRSLEQFVSFLQRLTFYAIVRFKLQITIWLVGYRFRFQLTLLSSLQSRLCFLFRLNFPASILVFLFSFFIFACLASSPIASTHHPFEAMNFNVLALCFSI